MVVRFLALSVLLLQPLLATPATRTIRSPFPCCQRDFLRVVGVVALPDLLADQVRDVRPGALVLDADANAAVAHVDHLRRRPLPASLDRELDLVEKILHLRVGCIRRIQLRQQHVKDVREQIGKVADILDAKHRLVARAARLRLRPCRLLLRFARHDRRRDGSQRREVENLLGTVPDGTIRALRPGAQRHGVDGIGHAGRGDGQARRRAVRDLLPRRPRIDSLERRHESRSEDARLFQSLQSRGRQGQRVGIPPQALNEGMPRDDVDRLVLLLHAGVRVLQEHLDGVTSLHEEVSCVLLLDLRKRQDVLRCGDVPAHRPGRGQQDPDRSGAQQKRVQEVLEAPDDILRVAIGGGLLRAGIQDPLAVVQNDQVRRVAAHGEDAVLRGLLVVPSVSPVDSTFQPISSADACHAPRRGRLVTEPVAVLGKDGRSRARRNRDEGMSSARDGDARHFAHDRFEVLPDGLHAGLA
mmetsp:Transcript_14849/g.56245  ORF Transcript_14849/g.56245 Transcript_14849/m.56245 type:complete len:469 (+) Transcript_14849:849-2255(+)